MVAYCARRTCHKRYKKKLQPTRSTKLKHYRAYLKTSNITSQAEPYPLVHTTVPIHLPISTILCFLTLCALLRVLRATGLCRRYARLLQSLWAIRGLFCSALLATTRFHRRFSSWSRCTRMAWSTLETGRCFNRGCSCRRNGSRLHRCNGTALQSRLRLLRLRKWRFVEKAPQLL